MNSELLESPHEHAIETSTMLRMIEASGVFPFMRFGASRILCAGVDEQVAVTLDLVARCPTVDVAPIPTTRDHVNVNDSCSERALPCALPIRHGRAASNEEGQGDD